MKKHSHRLSVMFSLLTVLTLALTALFSGLLTRLLIRTGLLDAKNRSIVFLIITIISILVGTVISKWAGRKPIASIITMSEAVKEVAKGNFHIQLHDRSGIRELQDMACNFNIMTRELAGTELLRTDFIENVSHEFKTPLAAIEGYAALLQRKGLSEEKKAEYTKRILYNTKRLSTLTSNILLLSRLENQETGIRKESFCLDEQLRETLLYLQEQWSEKHLILEIDLDNIEYNGSQELLSHVWENLLGNAIKFTPPGGRIVVLLHRESGKINIQISDTGIGINALVLPRIFEKFYQGDLSRSASGNGLGLSLVRRILDLHGGKISVSSQEGKGTTFTVFLPE